MTNIKILEMINNGEIDELKKILSDEIYMNSMNGNTDSKKRYAAMKKFIKMLDKHCNEKFKKPCSVDINGKKYFSFIDGYSIALTSENVGEIEQYNGDDYFDISKMISLNSEIRETININTILSDAKSRGYKLIKKEISDNAVYYLHYMEGFYKIGLVDKAYSIINTGTDVNIYYIDNRHPITIENEIGLCIVLPISVNDEKKFIENNIIIEV